MTVRIHGRNMQLQDQIKKIAEDQVRHAGRIFDDGGSVDVEFTEHQNPRLADERFRVEITSKAAGTIVRVEAQAPDPRAALDLATDKYERKLRRLKERLIQRNRVPNKGLNQVDGQPDEEDDRGAGIVRT
ncbi:MAG: ribosome-associated translation inhibitor RaiA, partial [Actinomycetia bacterium]|nr:ribosome-associated translation inhibitor RaiA [Actinomycetes bacterium]